MTKILATSIFIISIMLTNVFSNNQDYEVISVLPFNTLWTDENAEIWQTGFPASLNNDLIKIKKIKVIERIRLSEVLREMSLGMTGILDESQVKEVGKILQADIIITGDIQKMGSTFRVNCRLIEVETGQIISGITHKKTLNEDLDIFDFQDELAVNIIEKMNIHLSQSEQEDIQLQPTNSYDAFNFYSSAIRNLDQGENNKAKEDIEKSLTYDPNFSDAQQVQQYLITTLEQYYQSKGYNLKFSNFLKDGLLKGLLVGGAIEGICIASGKDCPQGIGAGLGSLYIGASLFSYLNYLSMKKNQVYVSKDSVRIDNYLYQYLESRLNKSLPTIGPDCREVVSGPHQVEGEENVFRYTLSYKYKVDSWDFEKKKMIKVWETRGNYKLIQKYENKSWDNFYLIKENGELERLKKDE